MCHGQKLVIPAIWIDVSIGNLDSHDMMGNHTTFIPYNLTIAQTHMYICIIYIYIHTDTSIFLWSQTFWLISYITLSRDKVVAFTLPSRYILPNCWCLNPTSSWIIQSVVKSNVTIHVFRVFVYIYIHTFIHTMCMLHIHFRIIYPCETTILNDFSTDRRKVRCAADAACASDGGRPCLRRSLGGFPKSWGYPESSPMFFLFNEKIIVWVDLL